MAARQAERRVELAGVAPLLVAVPWFPPETDDLTALARIGECLWA
jgi:hypothetical protein